MTLLATARIGGVHAVVFSGFSAEALADRVNDCGAKVLVTQTAASEEENQSESKTTQTKQCLSCRTSKKSSLSNARDNQFK